MKLRNLLHIRENDIYLIGSLTPPFFYRVSDIMNEFIQLCDNNTVETSLDLLKEKHSSSEFDNFQQRLVKIKDKLFVDNNYREVSNIDFSAKVSTLTLNVTRLCNMKCSYCFEDSAYRKLGHMSFDIAKKAIDTFFTTPINTPDWIIIFTGGEPILNYNLLVDVVKYIKDKGVNVEYRIKTNATLLDEEKMDFLIKNNFKIQISLDGGKQAHDIHRKLANGKGSFMIVDKVIKRLIEKEYGHRVTISGTLSHHTIKHIEDCYTNLNSYHEISHYSLKPVMYNSNIQFAFHKDDYEILHIKTLKNNKFIKKNIDQFRE